MRLHRWNPPPVYAAPFPPGLALRGAAAAARYCHLPVAGDGQEQQGAKESRELELVFPFSSDSVSVSLHSREATRNAGAHACQHDHHLAFQRLNARGKLLLSPGLILSACSFRFGPYLEGVTDAGPRIPDKYHP